MAGKILLVTAIIMAVLTVGFLGFCIWRRKEIKQNSSKLKNVGRVVLSLLLVVVCIANFVALNFTNLITQYFTSLDLDDPGVQSVRDAGWKVYVRFDLHAKTYVVDNKRGLVGSANATNSGLSIGKVGNMEMATLVDIESNDIEKINKLFNDAILVDNTLMLKMKAQIDAYSGKSAHPFQRNGALFRLKLSGAQLVD